MAVLDTIKNLTNSINNKDNTTYSSTSSNATQKKQNRAFGANFYPR